MKSSNKSMSGKSEKQGSRKAPRTHNPAWKDNTRKERQHKRREKLNEKARDAGFSSWSAYETAVINGEAELKVK
jgi:hypothetical protein